MDVYEELKHGKILLVEDDPWVRDSLSMFFRNKGCRMMALESIGQGYAAIAMERFDVVLCNHWPPEMDGLAFMERVGNVQPEAIRILLTSAPAAELADQPGWAGIDDSIQKPLTIERMERSLLRLLERSGRSARASEKPEDVPDCDVPRPDDGIPGR